jgi:hypothetical protein
MFGTSFASKELLQFQKLDLQKDCVRKIRGWRRPSKQIFKKNNFSRIFGPGVNLTKRFSSKNKTFFMFLSLAVL